MTPLLFNAGTPILSIVPPIRSSRSLSATTRWSRRPFQKYSTSRVSRAAPNGCDECQLIMIVQCRSVEVDQHASGYSRCIVASKRRLRAGLSRQPGKYPRWCVHRRSLHRTLHGQTHSALAPDAPRTRRAFRRPVQRHRTPRPWPRRRLPQGRRLLAPAPAAPLHRTLLGHAHSPERQWAERSRRNGQIGRHRVPTFRTGLRRATRR